MTCSDCNNDSKMMVTIILVVIVRKIIYGSAGDNDGGL